MTDLEDQIAEEMEADEDSSADDGDALVEGAGDGAGEDAAAASAPAPRSQDEIEKLTEKLAREADRHAKRVQEIMGEDFALLVPSPVDWTPGFIFNVPEMHPFPEQIDALLALVGRQTEDDLLDADDAEACDKCNARGITKTGSRVDGQRTKPCGKCNGNGWVTKFTPVVVQTGYSNGSPATGSAVISPETFAVTDRWGRPNGHPHFGLDPVTVGV